MSTNIVETLKGYISPELISKASSLLGESENNTATAFSQAIPGILAGLLHRSADANVVNTVAGAFKEPDLGNVLVNPATALTSGGSGLIEKGKAFLSGIFGDKLTALSNSLSESSGVKSSSATSILSMAAPLVLSFLGKKTKEEGIGVSGLAGFLASQKEHIIQSAPSGLAGALGLGSLSALGSNLFSNVQSAAGRVGNAVEDGASRTARFRPLWIIAAIAAIALIVWKNCVDKTGPATPPAADSTATAVKTTDTAAGKTDTAASPLGSLVSVKLPNGTELHVPELGIEKKLIAFIEDKNRPVDKTTWFSFDRLTFETNSATLKPESAAQLQDMANILKAYPQVELKLGGYTDNTGDPKNNLKLSGDRANSVLNELVKLGIDKSRLSAEGYGQEHPVADNSTEEGRAKNRRIDVRVTKK